VTQWHARARHDQVGPSDEGSHVRVSGCLDNRRAERSYLPRPITMTGAAGIVLDNGDRGTGRERVAYHRLAGRTEPGHEHPATRCQSRSGQSSTPGMLMKSA